MPRMIISLSVTMNFQLLEGILEPWTCKDDNQEIHTGMIVPFQMVKQLHSPWSLPLPPNPPRTVLITVFGGHASPYDPATKGLTPNTQHSKQPPNPCSCPKIPTHSDWSCLSIFNITPSDSLKKSIAGAYECMLIKRENHGRWEKRKKEKVLTLEFGGILLTAVVAGK